MYMYIKVYVYLDMLKLCILVYNYYDNYYIEKDIQKMYENSMYSIYKKSLVLRLNKCTMIFQYSEHIQ